MLYLQLRSTVTNPKDAALATPNPVALAQICQLLEQRLKTQVIVVDLHKAETH